MRADLAALTPEALAAMANVGLVKRAQREIEAGQGPKVHEDENGVVVATFPDGISTRLLPGKALKDTPCGCGAKTVCRHRIAAVLAYAAAAGTETRPPWEITAEEILVWLGERVTLVDAAEAAGVEVELGTNPPIARFSGCTVRFLAGADLAHARCDCATPRCVHVPLAVRAFQRLSAEDQARGAVQVRLGPPPKPTIPAAVLADVEGLFGRTLARGLADARGLAQAREEVRAQLKEYPWLDGLIEDLEAQREAWEIRSALHDAGEVRRLLAEGWARVRAARNGGEPAALLGLGEPLEVPLDRARLLSLGARLSAAGTARSLEVLFWDGATVVSWSVAIPDKVDPASVIAVAGTPLGVMAGGQVLSRHLVRLARRTIEIRRGKDTTVIPQRGAWGDIPAPFGFPGPSALLADETARPPAFLRPRARTAALRIVATNGGVGGLSWSPGRQTLSGWIEDEGARLRVERAHEWFAPGAIAALAEALPSARYVSGWLRESRGGRVLEPIAVVTDRVVIPDLAPAAPIPALPIAAPEAPDLLGGALGRLESALDALAQDGVLSARIPPLAPALANVGLRAMAATYSRLEAARAAGDLGEATKAFADAAILVALARA
ncbi:hypothetical protein [Polyangium jinanense]|uniref:SWIM-type domain-containing protein n=1 Tax=Polyangium jinanense TaxID=2829994 RepID=A0A9X3WYH9_9BACT|nr:hypothetical protein [Polyangium jinanense]MDC3952971.1 hypothetical protein [Polyangium jinanense]MDC3980589.1 hypothetical protein [Polyangium jinanense]